MDWTIGDALPHLMDTVVIQRLKPVKMMSRGKDNTKTKSKTLRTQPNQMQDTKYQHKDKLKPMQIQSGLVPQPTAPGHSDTCQLGNPTNTEPHQVIWGSFAI